jgi:hypothetical protein
MLYLADGTVVHQYSPKISRVARDRTGVICKITKNNTSITVVREIDNLHKNSDTYFWAMVYPSVPERVVATTTGAPCKETPTETKQEKPALPPGYEKYCAAFSKGLEKLPEHGPQDLEIKLKEGNYLLWAQCTVCQKKNWTLYIHT